MRRHLVADRFELEVGEAEQAIPADKRAIKGMKWVHVSSIELSALRPNV